MPSLWQGMPAGRMSTVSSLGSAGALLQEAWEWLATGVSLGREAGNAGGHMLCGLAQPARHEDSRLQEDVLQTCSTLLLSDRHYRSHHSAI